MVNLLFGHLNVNVHQVSVHERPDVHKTLHDECKTWRMRRNDAVANYSRLLFMTCVFHQIGMSVQRCSVLHCIPNVFHSVYLLNFIRSLCGD